MKAMTTTHSSSEIPKRSNSVKLIGNVVNIAALLPVDAGTDTNSAIKRSVHNIRIRKRHSISQSAAIGDRTLQAIFALH